MNIMDKVVAHYGNQTDMATTLGVTPGAVSQWVASGGVPASRAIQIEEDTGGVFKAIVLVERVK